MKKAIFIITAITGVFIMSCNNSNQENFKSPKEIFTVTIIRNFFYFLHKPSVIVDFIETDCRLHGKYLFEKY
jgi:hypothetical protein